MIRTSPKPFSRIIPRPKPERLPKGKRVTICAGFHCAEGIILCADTQETVGAFKRHVPKLGIRPFPNYREDSPHIVFAGAGEADLIEFLADAIGSAIAGQKTLDKMIEKAQKKLLEIYSSLSSSYQSGYMPEAWMLVGMSCPPHGCELVTISNGPIIRRNVAKDSIGCGTSLSTYLSDKLPLPKATFSEIVPAALYVIDQAKEHVDGCGGETHLATLRYDGKVEFESPGNIEAKTKQIREIEWAARNIVAFAVTRTDLPDADFAEAVQYWLDEIKRIRRPTPPP